MSSTEDGWEKPSMLNEDDEEESLESSDEADYTVHGGVTIVFEELSLLNKRGQYVLQDLYGIIKAGRVTGLLGSEASGAANDLMKCLGGFADASEGQIFANGLPIEASPYRRCVGYVPNVHIDRVGLTVTQNLHFFYVMKTKQPKASARESLRFADSDIDAEEIKCPNCSTATTCLRVCHQCGCLIEGWRLAALTVNLAEYGDCLLSECNEEVRKRVSLASVLLHLPKVLFLEVPTVTLDLSAGLRFMKFLQSLARDRGIAVVLTLSQPRRPLFEILDNVLLLDKGGVAFSGKSSQVLPYFVSLGHDVGEYDCPSDYFLDIIDSEEEEKANPLQRNANQQLHSKPSREVSANTIPDLETSLKVSHRGSSPDPDTFSRSSRGASRGFTSFQLLNDPNRVSGACESALVRSYKKSKYFTALRASIVDYYKEAFANVTPGIAEPDPPSFLTRLKYLFYFRWVSSFNEWGQGLARLLLVITLGVVAGLAYSNSDGDNKQYEMQNRVGMLFFILSAMLLGNLNSASEFVARRPLLEHEVSSGYYNLPEYIITHVACDVIIVRGFFTVVFAFLMYMLTVSGIGLLSRDSGAFGSLVLCMTMTQLPFSILALFVGSLAPNTAVAQLVMISLFVLFVAFGGFFLNVASLPVPLNIVQYASLLRYSYESLIIGELKNRTFDCDTSKQPNCYTGDDYLEMQGFDDYGRQWDNIYILTGFTVFYLVLALVMLWCKRGIVKRQ